MCIHRVRVGAVLVVTNRAAYTEERKTMAIGSEGEIGTNFTVWKDMSEEDRKAWFKYMNDNWGEYLQAGYAKLIHNKDNRYYKKST